MKNVGEMALLFDFYGRLLTAKQQKILSLYYEQDFSLGEIAEESGVSRQAVHDILKRGEKLLARYEEKLGLVTKFTTEREKLNSVLDLTGRIEGNAGLVRQIKAVLQDIIQIQQGD